MKTVFLELCYCTHECQTIARRSISLVSRRCTAFLLYNGSKSNLLLYVGDKMTYQNDLSECTDVAWILHKMENYKSFIGQARPKKYLTKCIIFDQTLQRIIFSDLPIKTIGSCRLFGEEYEYGS